MISKSRAMALTTAVLACVVLYALARASGVVGVRWQDAYSVLEAPERNLPRDAAERERLLLAWAQTDSAPPIGLAFGPRLHQAGTAVLLRYDVEGEGTYLPETLFVRAIVPPWPQTPWPLACPHPCMQAALDANGTVVGAAGSAGISHEWILRMPVGRSFYLDEQVIQTQDLFSGSPYTLRAPNSAAGRLRITLVEACQGRLRLGSQWGVDFLPNTTVPIPSGIRTDRWLMLENCEGTLRHDKSPEEVKARARGPSARELSPNALILPVRDARTGAHALRINEAELLRRGKTLHVRHGPMCRYEPESRTWRRLSWHYRAGGEEFAPDVALAKHAHDGRSFLTLEASAPGLYWIAWEEMHSVRTGPDALLGTDPKQPAVAGRRDSAFLHPGSVQCNDLRIGPQAPGMLAMCVPERDSARALMVPLPNEACAQTP